MIKFISFADSRMTLARVRIEAQARAMGVFDEIETYDESAIFPDLEQWRDLFAPGSKGRGYWRWKPYIILKALQRLKDGDVLIYCDAGCHLNAKGKDRLSEYLSALKDDSFGVMAFAVEEKIDGLPCLEKYCTKGDAIDYFRCRNRDDILDSFQVSATHVFCRKCPKSVSLVKDWLETWQKRPKLFDDSPSASGNLVGFRVHRHDQSCIYLLFKLYGGRCLPPGEVWTGGNWEKEMGQQPIWDVRDRGLYTRPMLRLTAYWLLMFLPGLRAKYTQKMEQYFSRRPYLRPLFTPLKVMRILFTRRFTEKTARQLLNL